MTEGEKMLAGLPYDAMDAELVAGRERAMTAMMDFNAEPDRAARNEILRGLLGGFGEGTEIEPPLHLDYGTHLQLGADSFINAGTIILDCAAITVGDRVQIGPAVKLLAADHPREVASRAAGIELALPVTIGDDVWIGAGAILCPGISVGDGSVIGAGSVVTSDVPAGVVAAGNPCRIVREL